MINLILSQDYSRIVATDSVAFISINKMDAELGSETFVLAHIKGEEMPVELGKYSDNERAKKVMCFLGIEITRSNNKTIVLPPDNLFTPRVSVDPVFEKFLRDIFGGDKKI